MMNSIKQFFYLSLSGTTIKQHEQNMTKQNIHIYHTLGLERLPQ